MNIVGSNSFLRNLRNLEYFKLDLGSARRNIKTGTFNKLSEFEMKYKSIFSNPLIKYGAIGRATFYEDLYIKEPKYYIFSSENNEAYEIHYTEDEIVDFSDYILTSMRKIEEAEKEEKEEINEVSSDVESDIKNSDGTWESDDIKNGKKKYLINQKLNREEYRRQFLNRKRG